uniref:Uncharacterized protein n=1 Tax=Moorena producens (strain JHB) TaxID=1454205 RepID=A0A1D9G8P1_MOOP1
MFCVTPHYRTNGSIASIAEIMKGLSIYDAERGRASIPFGLVPGEFPPTNKLFAQRGLRPAIANQH